ncbi:MAG: response regulator [Xenococcaceae cyanobacterium]
MVSSQIIKNVLFVEDNPSYRDLMLVAFEENGIEHNLYMVSNAEEALLFLQQQETYAHAPRPDLIMLDLDLPKMHGHELLKIIKQDLKLKLIPVIVFTSSIEQKDILESYNLKANCYLNKPYNLEDFLAVVQKSLNFWLNFSKLPQS